jgi:hypothetical protein
MCHQIIANFNKIKFNENLSGFLKLLLLDRRADTSGEANMAIFKTFCCKQNLKGSDDGA